MLLEQLEAYRDKLQKDTPWTGDLLLTLNINDPYTLYCPHFNKTNPIIKNMNNLLLINDSYIIFIFPMTVFYLGLVLVSDSV